MKDNWVVIADITDSRKIKNRKEAQFKMEETLQMINNKYDDFIKYSFEITLGDQFRGVVSSLYKLHVIIIDIIVNMEDIIIKFGLGKGSIEIDKKNTLIGGSGYKRAVSALKKAKNNKYPLKMEMPKKDQNNNIIKFYEISLLLLVYYFSQFTTRQKQVVHMLIKGFKQKEVACKLGITQPAVSQTANVVEWKLLRAIYKDIIIMEKYSLDSLSISFYYAIIGCWEIKHLTLTAVDKILKNINYQYSEDIVSKFVKTEPSSTVDGFYEFQGLVKKWKVLIEILFIIYISMDSLYLGIGRGEITTALKKNALGMDGSAFYRARKAVNQSLEGECFLKVVNEKNNFDRFLSSICALLFNISSFWTDKQLEAVILRKRRGLKHKEIAQKIGVERASITERLQRADYDFFVYLLEKLKRLY